MRLTHSFTVPADPEQAWQVLLDIERVAPCMPGAALESVNGDDFTGSVKVRLGPIGLTYKGKASFIEKDVTARRVVIDAQAKDVRGNGTAKARITATLAAQGSGTAVDVVTDLNITGKPAQFGRGVMVDVGNKLIGQFADCLAGKLSEPDAAGLEAAEPEAAEPDVSAPAEGGPADGGEAVVALPGPAPDEVALEPSAAAEAAPPARRLSAVDAVSAEPTVAPAVAPVAVSRPAQPPAQRPAVADVEPINLLGSAGPALAKRLVPLAAVALLIVVVLLRRRRR